MFSESYRSSPCRFHRSSFSTDTFSKMSAAPPSIVSEPAFGSNISYPDLTPGSILITVSLDSF